MNKIKCKVFGHSPTGLITGFNSSGEVITRCRRCAIPIVCKNWQGSHDVMTRYFESTEAAIEMLRVLRYLEQNLPGFKTEGPAKEKMSKWAIALGIKP